MKITIRQLGPSMIQQMQQPCNECKGTGESINEKDRCPRCKGEKVVQEKKVLEVHVEKGMQHNQKITFPGEANEAVCLFYHQQNKCELAFNGFRLYNVLSCSQPDTVTGDIVFVLQQKDHSKFKRKGDDLFYEHTLSLAEALCGFQFVLTHLDNRQLLIKSNPGEVVKPGKTLFLWILSGTFTFAVIFVGNPCFINLSRPVQGDKRRGDANVPEAFHEGQALHSFHGGVP
jgi:DnaJ homolog subfamily A member 2